MRTSIIAASLVTTLFLAGCDSNDGPIEKAAENVDEAVDDMTGQDPTLGENIDKSLDQAGDAIADTVDDAGDALDEAGEKMEEAVDQPDRD